MFQCIMEGGGMLINCWKKGEVYYIDFVTEGLGCMIFFKIKLN